MKMVIACKIVSVGKRRDGGTKYWCLNHKADATAKYGRPDVKCRYADVPPIRDKDSLVLDSGKYKGGIAVWGAIPALYDTTSLASDRGIHVHARMLMGGKKIIDRTYRSIKLKIAGNSFELTELDAIYFMVSSIFGLQMKYIECPICHWPHLDKDWFSIHPHKRHLCSKCGKNFSDFEYSIGNPISDLCQVIHCPKRKNPKQSKKVLKIKQADYPGGIQVWGSNPAILWTSGEHEESGIHVHIYSNDGSERIKDDTFGSVVIDGEKLEPVMVRTMMAQKCLPHLMTRIVSLKCNKCGDKIFDQGMSAYTPTKERACLKCGNLVKSNTRLKKVVSNPLNDIFDDLSSKATNPRQAHLMNLIPETI